MNIELIFSEIVFTEQNPHIFEIEEIFKQDGEIVKNSRTESYVLEKYSNLERDIIDRVIEKSSVKKLKYPKNFIQRIYKKNELEMLDISENDLIISNQQNLRLISSKNTLEFDCEKLIISDRRQKIFINKEEKSFYFDLDGFRVFEIN